jgi:hypothetical protein
MEIYSNTIDIWLRDSSSLSRIRTKYRASTFVLFFSHPSGIRQNSSLPTSPPQIRASGTDSMSLTSVLDK